MKYNTFHGNKTTLKVTLNAALFLNLIQIHGIHSNKHIATMHLSVQLTKNQFGLYSIRGARAKI